MINIQSNRTLTLNTWNRYVAYVHRLEMTIGWEKKCYTIIPLNYIDPRFELIETVYFENYVQLDDPNSGTGLLTYMEGFLATVYNYECDFEKNYLHLVKEFGFESLPSRNRRSDRVWTFWRDYFESYEVKGFKGEGWVVESPFEDEINFPTYLEYTYKGELKGKPRYKIRDRFALEK